MRTVSNAQKEKKSVWLWRRGKTFLTTVAFLLVEFSESKHNKVHLKPAIKLVDWISKVDTLPFGQKLSQFRPLLQAEVVSNKVSVDTIFPPLLGVVQDVWGCVTGMDKHFKSQLQICLLLHEEQYEDFFCLCHSPSSLICSYFFLAMNLLQDFWMILAKVSNFLSLISSSRKSYGATSMNIQYMNIQYAICDSIAPISCLLIRKFVKWTSAHRNLSASHLRCFKL